MKVSNLVKLSVATVVLLLIPKRSSPQADNIAPTKPTQKPTHD